MLAHGAERGGRATELLLDLLPLLAAVVLLAAYLVAVRRLRRRGDRWSRGRTAAAVLGGGCLAAAAAVDLLLPHAGFPGHVAAHLLASGAGPVLLALAAPVTLALRVTRGPLRRAMVGVLHGRGVRILASAPMIVALQLGGLAVYYLTPLYARAEDAPLLHLAVHTHMVLAGVLVSVYVAGVDPLPARERVASRAGVLLLTAGGHDVLAKYLYAHGLPAGAGSPEDLRAGAMLLYYGGDAVELGLAVALCAGWYARTGRRRAHAIRRVTRPADAVS